MYPKVNYIIHLIVYYSYMCDVDCIKKRAPYLTLTLSSLELLPSSEKDVTYPLLLVTACQLHKDC